MECNEKLYEALKALENTSTECTHDVSSKIGALDLQVKQFKYLHIIENNENLTFSELAKILNITKPSVTEIVNKLIKAGCVVKRQSEEDGRVFFIETTEKGRKVAGIKKLARTDLCEMVMKNLNSEEIETLIKLLNKITSTPKTT